MDVVKKYRSIIMTGALILFFAGAFMLGNIYARYSTERVVLASSGKGNSEEKLEDDGNIEEMEKAEQLAISRQMAEYILEEMADKPLLQEYAKNGYGDASLENIINDVNAAKCAKEAIIRVCGEAGIDVKMAEVSDLTEDQIVEIDQEVYGKSDHPKD
ncbi:MAG: hypothetical protein K2L07_06420 [Lachnospiraceae bacterium]|nr:hypothetical protein [Lachnospiraceae bacterium]